MKPTTPDSHISALKNIKNIIYKWGEYIHVVENFVLNVYRMSQTIHANVTWRHIRNLIVEANQLFLAAAVSILLIDLNNDSIGIFAEVIISVRSMLDFDIS